MQKRVKNVILSVLISLVTAIIVTLIYIKLPPFYITSLNFSIVPEVELEEDEFNYNGFYQSELSNNIVNSVSVFASSSDFKRTLEQNTNKSILYLLSTTRGRSIISLRIVTLDKIEMKRVQEQAALLLNKSLEITVPNEIIYSTSSLDDFNHQYAAGIPVYRFFIIAFSTFLVLSSMFLLAKNYYQN